MPSILNATTTSGLVTSADNSGSLQLQTNNGTTAVTISTGQQVQVNTAGSASAPVISKSDDANTGIFFPAADTIAFSEGGTEIMRIDSSGNVGVRSSGTTTPTYDFNTLGEGLWSRYWDSSGNRFADLVAIANTPAGATQSMRFFTNSGGSPGTATERMRITSGGDVCINTATVLDQGKVNIVFAGNSNQGIVLNDSAAGSGNQQIRFKSGGTTVGNITTTTTATTYGTSSDYRLKENIAPMTGALSKVAELKPVTYTWKRDGSAGQGFIAHELQAVVPDCVTGEKDAVETYTDEEGNEQTRPVYQGVDTSFLVATLTAAIQEQQAMIETIKAELDATKAEVQALKGVA